MRPVIRTCMTLLVSKIWYIIQRYYNTKVLLTKVLFGQRYYKTKVLSGTKSDQYLIFNWNMKLWPFSHPLMSQSKNLKPNLSPWPFSATDSAADSAASDDTSGYDSRSRSNVTLAKAGPPDSQVNNTPFRHQVDGQECLQPPDPASHHIVLKTRINSQLVWSISKSLATVSVVVPIRVTIAFQPNLANGSHIARSHTFREIATPIFADCAATTPR